MANADRQHVFNQERAVAACFRWLLAQWLGVQKSRGRP
jgi:hypothetical protein